MSDASQVPFTLFSDVAGENYGPAKSNTVLPRGPEHPQRRNESTAVVGYSRKEQYPAFTCESQGCRCRKDGVQMSTQHYRISPDTIVSCDDIPDIVCDGSE